ncbi:hypothetical protein [Vibrio phage VP16T]|nr:hypothetical protein [Vibrio phage VP16T]
MTVLDHHIPPPPKAPRPPGDEQGASWVSVPREFMPDVVALVASKKREKEQRTMVITPEDLDTMKYFIEEKGDVTRWVDWDEKKDAIFALHPELRRALNDLELAELRLAQALEGIG